MHLPGLARARRSLENSGRFPSGALNPDIAESWLRSLEVGLDPIDPLQMDVITAPNLKELRQRHEDLIHHARPELELLYDQISGSNFMIALGSPEGIVLETLADRRFIDSSAGQVVIPGSVWTEERRGTNAMGLTLKTLRPAQVYGGEHFLRDHGSVSCISAPIFDGRGNLSGILDASTSVLSRQQHTSALVQMSASNIENAYIRSSYADNLVLLFHPRPEYLSTLSVGMLVLTEDYQIYAVNRKGQLLLSGQGDLVGKHFQELFDAPVSRLMNQLAKGETIRVRDMLGSGVSMRCVANRASFGLANRRMALGSHSSIPQKTARPTKLPSWVRHLALNDATWRQHLAVLPDLLRQNVNILITGPSGSGKEIFARLAHAQSGCSGKFVPVDCLTMDRVSFIDQFFGSEQPSGARVSLLEMAAGGTLFLDHVDALGPEIQALLERFLQTRERPRRFGSPSCHEDIRVIAATRQPLQALRQNATGMTPAFLERLAGMTFVLPAVNKRTDFAESLRATLRQIREDAIISDAAVQALQLTRAPESFFELSNILRAALSGKTEPEISTSDFRRQSLIEQPEAVSCDKCAGSAVKAQRCAMIRMRVSQFNGNVAAAARELGLSRTTIYAHLSQADK